MNGNNSTDMLFLLCIEAESIAYKISSNKYFDANVTRGKEIREKMFSGNNSVINFSESLRIQKYDYDINTQQVF